MVLGVIANICEVADGWFGPSDAQSAPIPAVNQLTHDLMVNELASVGGSQTLPQLPEKPLIMIHEALNSLLHQGTHIASTLGGKPGKPGLQLWAEIHFHV
jgi:hypothetical protein